MSPMFRTRSTQLFVQVQLPISWGAYQAELAFEELKHKLYCAGVAVGEAEHELSDTTEQEYQYRLNVWAPYDKLGGISDVLRALPQS